MATMVLQSPYSRVSFRMTSSELAKYSMTRSIPRAVSATAELLVA